VVKTMGLAIGIGIGYLAGNEQARRKAWDLLRQAKASPQAKAIEDKVSDKVTSMTPGSYSTTNRPNGSTQTPSEPRTPVSTGSTSKAAASTGS
jgi:hypothetical protein